MFVVLGFINLLFVLQIKLYAIVFLIVVYFCNSEM